MNWLIAATLAFGGIIAGLFSISRALWGIWGKAIDIHYELKAIKAAVLDLQGAPTSPKVLRARGDEHARG